MHTEENWPEIGTVIRLANDDGWREAAVTRTEKSGPATCSLCGGEPPELPEAIVFVPNLPDQALPMPVCRSCCSSRSDAEILEAIKENWLIWRVSWGDPSTQMRAGARICPAVPWDRPSPGGR